MKKKKPSSRAGLPLSNYHFCAVVRCDNQISDGGPDLCPEHHENACPSCKGRGEVIWCHNEANENAVQHKKCKVCKGKGVIK